MFSKRSLEPRVWKGARLTFALSRIRSVVEIVFELISVWIASLLLRCAMLKAQILPMRFANRQDVEFNQYFASCTKEMKVIEIGRSPCMCLKL